MAASIFDTYGMVKRLMEAGMPEKQAETLVNEEVRLMAEHLATKADVEALATKASVQALATEMARNNDALKAEIARVNDTLQGEMALIRQEMQTTESRLIARLGGVMAALLALLFAALKLTL